MSSRGDSGEGHALVEVVYVVASMKTGGTQTHLLQVLRLLDRSRFRPHLYCLRDQGDLIEAARSLGVDVRSFSMIGSLKDPRDLSGLIKLRRALVELRPGVVHGYLLRGNFYAALSGAMASVPVVVTSKRGLHRPATLSERVAVRISNRLSTAIAGNSPAVLDFTRQIEGRVPEPMVMIPSGIDTERFSPGLHQGLRSELGLGQAPVVGTVFTWRPLKGFRLLFEAFARLRAQLPDARLLVAGESELVGDPAELARSLGIAEAIICLGRRGDIPAVLATFDVFVLPSQSEGMSNALLEAMAMERTVVATAVGGNPHVIEEAKSGFLVDYPDVEGLAERIGAVLADTDIRRVIGRAARQRIVTEYSAASMVRQIEDLYQRLLAQAPGSPLPQLGERRT